jgi:hypothetical protein
MIKLSAMKHAIFFGLACCISWATKAQSDSSKTQKPDTVKIGNITIIKEDGKGNSTTIRGNDTTIVINKRAKVSTNWWIVDLGFSNYNDQTNYANTLASGVTGVGVGKDQLEARTGKSINVNIWLFMQRVSLIKNVVNLKYGLGAELNNYRYNSPILYQTNPRSIVLDNRNYRKNKLAADYLTVPMMLNFDLSPGKKKGFSFSAGASAGYLYSARQKTITSENGKQKERDNFGLRKFKLSYIAELGLGPIKLYGSVASQSMFENGIDQTPFNVGLRFSN